MIALFAAHRQPFTKTESERLTRAADSGNSQQIARMLSDRTLLQIQINPESRVKVIRGLARATLNADQENLFLVRVVNEGGVTAPLNLSGPNLAIEDGHASSERNRWLRATVLAVGPSDQSPRLSGRPVEYLVLDLTTRHTGMREATLAFDVGQGTQDLGFRGECAVLFRRRPSPRPPRIQTSLVHDGRRR